MVNFIVNDLINYIMFIFIYTLYYKFNVFIKKIAKNK